MVTQELVVIQVKKAIRVTLDTLDVQAGLGGQAYLGILVCLAFQVIVVTLDILGFLVQGHPAGLVVLAGVAGLVFLVTVVLMEILDILDLKVNLDIQDIVAIVVTQENQDLLVHLVIPDLEFLDFLAIQDTPELKVPRVGQAIQEDLVGPVCPEHQGIVDLEFLATPDLGRVVTLAIMVLPAIVAMKESVASQVSRASQDIVENLVYQVGLVSLEFQGILVIQVL